MNRTEALRTLVTRSVVLLRFVKKDGTLRRMVCYYAGGPVRGAMMQVWDVERGGYRNVNLGAVQSLRVMRTRAADRPPVRSGQETAAPGSVEVRGALISDLY